MSDLSQVPLLVLEKVRNKWWDITDREDRRIHHPCAMCKHVRRMPCEAYCPIYQECDLLTDSENINWSDDRDEFLDMIIAEIDRRSA